jgi:hypothetical protein
VNNLGYRNNYPEQDHEDKRKVQRHVHELQGSVKFAEPEDPHGHRFCTVTGEAIPCNEGDHIHEVEFRTDYYDEHYHEFCGKTGGAIPVGDRHVHYIEAITSMDDGHRHAFEAATLIEDPTGMDHKCKDHDHKDDHHPRNNYYRRY